MTAGSSSEAARRSPEAASEVGEASRIAAEVEERWRAVKLVEEQLAAREAALRSAEQAQAQAAGQPVVVPSSIHIPPHEERLQIVAAQATEVAGVSRPAAGGIEPEWSSCASSEGDRVMEFGEQLAAQRTVQAQQQQQELAVKVLAAQAESAERHRGEVASVKSEFDQEPDRMGKVTREVASSAHKGLVTALEVAASTDRKVSACCNFQCRHQPLVPASCRVSLASHRIAPMREVSCWAMRPQSLQPALCCVGSRSLKHQRMFVLSCFASLPRHCSATWHRLPRS